MTCNEARELLGADPDSTPPELLAHLESCAECRAYRTEMQALNARIRRALELDLQKLMPGARTGSPPSAGPTSGSATAPAAPQPAQPASQPTQATPQPASAAPPPSNVTPFRRRAHDPVQKQKRPGLFAFAASLAAALVVGFTLWLSRPPESLAAEIVQHVNGEPKSWARTQPVEARRLDAVLRKSGVKLGAGMEPVVYASACWFRGHFVPHMVVTTKNGPVTVIILKNETIPAEQQFSENGYSGLLVPARTGSVAVLSRTPMQLDEPAREVVRALESAN